MKQTISVTYYECPVCGKNSTRKPEIERHFRQHQMIVEGNMERLTMKYCGEYVPRELCSIDRLGGADDCDLCCEYCKATEEGSQDCSECAIGKCFNKLGKYEDLEERGKLLKLPCKAGQKVFLLRKDIKSVIDGEISSIRLGEFANEIKIFIIDDNRYTDASFDKIGDIVFFTREEAESALKEL